MEETTEGVVQQDGVTGAEHASGERTDQQQQAEGGDEVAALRAELARIRAKARELEGWRTERESADADAQRQAAIAAGKHTEVIAELQSKLEASSAELASVREREQARLGRVSESNERRLKALPARLRALVPEGLEPDAVAEQLGRLERLEPGGPTGGTRAHGGGAPEIPDDCIAEAARHKRDPQWWFDNVWAPRMAKRQRESG